MKKIIMFFLVAGILAACKKDPDYSKPGVSLPEVSNLNIQRTDTNRISLSWAIPAGIPAEINQPLSVNVQVTEILSPTRSIVIASEMLPEAPLTWSYTLPNTAGTYHFTVKLFGTTKSADRNYSNTIYSLGQTAIFSP